MGLMLPLPVEGSMLSDSKFHAEIVVALTQQIENMSKRNSVVFMGLSLLISDAQLFVEEFAVVFYPYKVDSSSNF